MKQHNDYVLLSLLAVFLILTLVAGILMISFTATGGVALPDPDGTLPPLDSDTNEQVNGPILPEILGETSDQGEDYIKKIIFVGDSTTYHLIARGVLPDGTDTTQVWCPGNGTLLLSSAITSLDIVYPKTDEEMTIAEAAALEKPEYMVLTIGLNGAHNFKEQVYKGSYGKLIEAIRSASPDTKIILQSVFPVAVNETAWQSLTPAELNEKIDLVNEWAKDLTLEYENVRYLDTQSVLRDGENYLKAEYQSGDGIHLTAEGYREILKYIRTHAWS